MPQSVPLNSVAGRHRIFLLLREFTSQCNRHFWSDPISLNIRIHMGGFTKQKGCHTMSYDCSFSLRPKRTSAHSLFAIFTSQCNRHFSSDPISLNIRIHIGGFAIILVSCLLLSHFYPRKVRCTKGRTNEAVSRATAWQVPFRVCANLPNQSHL